ncbi:MAG: helix-turn-helix domain-containing protein [Candidatus Kurthia intestinigallinarum]
MEEHEHITKQQQAWYEGIQMLNQSLDRQTLLTTIIDNVMLAMPAVDRGFFTLYDAQQQRLVPVASAGLKESIYLFKTAIGEGIVGKIFQSRQARAFTNEQAHEAMRDLTAENAHHLMVAVDSTEQQLNQQISMAAPVTLGDTCYGVLMLHQFTSKLHPHQLTLLQAFADQAAVALHNAELYEQMEQAHAHLVKQQHIHTLFIDLALENSDIAHIMHTASTLINHQIYFIDHRKFQLYPANNKLQQQLKEMDSSHWAKRKARLVRIHEQGYFVYPVLNGEVVIGYLFIETTQVPIDTELVVIEQTGVVMALKISNHRSMEEILNRQRQELVSQLLRQQPLQRIQGRAQALGLILHEPVMVILMQMHVQEKEHFFTELYTYQFLQRLDDLEKEPLFFYKEIDHVVIISSSTTLYEKIDAIAADWNAQSPVTISIAVSSMQPSFERFIKTYEEAENTLHYMQMRKQIGVLYYEKLGVNQLFMKQDPEAITQFLTQTLAPLQTPRAQASELEDTLRSYIYHSRSITKTAAALHIHQNTLYHRLTKIEELLQMNLNDWNDYLALSLAFHLQQFE